MTKPRRGAMSFLAALSVAIAVAAPAFPQEQHTAELSKVVRLNRAPVNNEILQVTLPKPVVTETCPTASPCWCLNGTSCRQ